MGSFGILTVIGTTKPVAGNLANFRRISHCASRKGIVCRVIALDPLGQTRMYRILGDKFLEVDEAIPHVLYNRIPTRRWERLPDVKNALRSWHQSDHIVTNPRFLRKDEVVSLWSADPALTRFVPEARPLRLATDVMDFLRDRPRVYVKPIDGKAGKGMVSLRREGARYRVMEQRVGAVRDDGLRGAAWLERQAEGQWVRRGTFLQEEADTALWTGRKFDLRILLHRGRGERFRVTGVGARVGPRGGIVTHVPNGGTIASAAAVLKAVYGEAASRVYDGAMLASLSAAEAVGRLPGVWSELSIDLGLTPDGMPTLFEANAKPMKFDEPLIERRAKATLVSILSQW